MDLIYIGKIVNTHGIKGEVRIISDFKYKKEVFKENSSIYIDDIRYMITSARKHKNFDMVTLLEINDINDALNLKGKNVYISRDDYKFESYLNEDLIGLEVYDNDMYKGKVIDVLKTNKYDLLVINGKKKHFVPNIEQFVKNVDLDNKKIFVEYIKGLDYED